MDVTMQDITQQSTNTEKKRQDLQSDLVRLREQASMGALTVLPVNTQFETKDTEEQIILLLRRHFATNFKWLISAIFLAIIPLAGLVFNLFPQSLSYRYHILLTFMWELVVLGYAFEQFLVWLFNVYIITNERIVDIDFHNLLNREISDADLDKIQDITITSKGFGAAFFEYGDITIQTAAEKQLFDFNYVPRPEGISRVIRELTEYITIYRKESE